MTEERPDSFPYLHLSRRLCVPYAHVLEYVDKLDENMRRPRGEGAERSLHLSPVDECRVQDVWMHEQLRRIPERQE